MESHFAPLAKNLSRGVSSHMPLERQLTRDEALGALHVCAVWLRPPLERSRVHFVSRPAPDTPRSPHVQRRCKTSTPSWAK